jgi:DNA-binding MarR family transcriptional regulator
MDNENIGYLLHRVGFALDRHSDQVLRERLGIGFSQFKILLVLEENNGGHQRLIAQSLGQTEASISRQIGIMIDKGLVLSRRSKQNKREHSIFLTENGEMLTERAIKVLNDYHSPVFSALNEKQQQQLLETLNIIKNYLV